MTSGKWGCRYVSDQMGTVGQERTAGGLSAALENEEVLAMTSRCLSNVDDTEDGAS